MYSVLIIMTKQQGNSDTFSALLQSLSQGHRQSPLNPPLKIIPVLSVCEWSRRHNSQREKESHLPGALNLKKLVMDHKRAEV